MVVLTLEVPLDHVWSRQPLRMTSSSQQSDMESSKYDKHEKRNKLFNFSVSSMLRWRHQMETFSALLAISAGNSPVPGEFPAQRPVTRSFDVFFDLHPNKRLSEKWWGWWFKTSSCPLWRHHNAYWWPDTARTPVHKVLTLVRDEIYIKCRLDCRYSPRNIFNAKNLIHIKSRSLC